MAWPEREVFFFTSLAQQRQERRVAIASGDETLKRHISEV